MEDANQLFEPVWETVGELEFQNCYVGKHTNRIGHFDRGFGAKKRLDANLAVKRDPDRIIVRADPGLAQVVVMRFGPGIELVKQQREPLQSCQMPALT